MTLDKERYNRICGWLIWLAHCKMSCRKSQTRHIVAVQCSSHRPKCDINNNYKHIHLADVREVAHWRGTLVIATQGGLVASHTKPQKPTENGRVRHDSTHYNQRVVFAAFHERLCLYYVVSQ
jgi:hypothetical protein